MEKMRLDSYCFAKISKRLQLPSLVYLKELANETEQPMQIVRGLADRYLNDEFKPKWDTYGDLNSTPLFMGMYNAVVNTEKRINISKLLDKTLEKGLVTANNNNLGFKVVRITARYGKFVKALEITSEYGMKLHKKVDPSVYTSIEYIVKIDGKAGGSFTVFNSGRLRFSAGYVFKPETRNEARAFLNFMKNYIDVPANSEIVYNNVTGDFNISKVPELVPIFSLLDPLVTKALASFNGMLVETEYKPERVQVLNNARKTKKKLSPFLYVKFENFMIILSNSNRIQIEGTRDIKSAYDITKLFLEELNRGGLFNNRRVNMNARTPKATKVMKRANSLPAPEVTRRGTTCPPNRVPKPYSFQGQCPPGFYVKPNPQGQPCCYKIPKSIRYSRDKVVDAYRKAGVKVPEAVQKIFGFGMNTENLPANVTGKELQNLVTLNDPKSGFMIGSRQCLRYSKVSLVDIAKRMNIPVPRVISKPELCKLIREKSKASGTNRTKNFSSGAVVIQNRLKFGKRFCDSYTKPDIVKMARKLGMTGLSPESKKQDLCKAVKSFVLQKKRNELNLSRETLKRNLTRLFGNRNATNKNVNNLIKFMKTKNVNATRSEIERLEREFVELKK